MSRKEWPLSDRDDIRTDSQLGGQFRLGVLHDLNLSESFSSTIHINISTGLSLFSWCERKTKVRVRTFFSGHLNNILFWQKFPSSGWMDCGVQPWRCHFVSPCLVHLQDAISSRPTDRLDTNDVALSDRTSQKNQRRKKLWKTFRSVLRN